MSNNPQIPGADFPLATPGATDTVLGVDESSRALRRFRRDSFPLSAADHARLQALEAGQSADMLGFTTKAAMDAALAYPEGTLALVTNDGTAANNGTYRKVGASGAGNWVLSADRVTGLEGRVAGIESDIAPLDALAEAVNPSTPNDDILAVADAAGKLVFRIKGNAVPDFDVDDELMNKVNRSKLETDISGVAYAITDAAGKVLLSIENNGTARVPGGVVATLSDESPATDGAVSEYALGALPYLRGQSVVLSRLVTRATAVQHSTTIYGRDTGSGRPSKVITNDSLTHPKVLHIPGGWRGYEYWMAVTPYFGSSYAEESENPHILASNDGLSFSEIPSGPIDMAGDGDSYWSDTHLALGDDGWLYCFYRGVNWPAVGGEPAGTRNYYQRSRNGVNWSGRTFFHTSQNTVSPVVMPSPRGGFDYFEVALAGSGSAFADGKRQISRRWSAMPNGPVPARENADCVTLNNRPWESELGALYDLWHIDISRVGNLWVALFCVRPTSGGGPDLNYLAWSPDGWTWTVLPGAVGPGSAYYRSCIVPVSFGTGAAEIDLYLAAGGTGVISVHRATLEMS